jgi:hypothetical protein
MATKDTIDKATVIVEMAINELRQPRVVAIIANGVAPARPNTQQEKSACSDTRYETSEICLHKVLR